MRLDDLSRIPTPPRLVSPAISDAIDDSVRYLGTVQALRSLEADTYWPKWDSPWWHMLLLHELGEARRIPERVATAMVDGLEALPLKIFPIRPEELPPGADASRASSCHCALGCIDAVLAACGVDVERALPWIEPWFVRYQMADGGLSCDGTAYLQTAECPSSMVGTIAPLEAMLRSAPAEWTPEHRQFVARAAQFLVDRRLTLGSASVHNAEERESALGWVKPCFPRFYFYDVLRGLAALVRWAEVTGGSIPWPAVADAVEHLVRTYPDGVVRVERAAHAGHRTLRQGPTGWVRHDSTSSFPLLAATSGLGEPSPYLTGQWADVRRGLLEHVVE